MSAGVGAVGFEAAELLGFVVNLVMEIMPGFSSDSS